MTHSDAVAKAKLLTIITGSAYAVLRPNGGIYMGHSVESYSEAIPPEIIACTVECCDGQTQINGKQVEVKDEA